MTQAFVDTYKKRLEKICIDTDQEIKGAPVNIASQTAYIHSMLKKVVDVSMQGL
jgi:hypothetical protein